MTLWPRQTTGEVGYKRTVSEYDGPEEGRAAHRAQALEAAARRYVPTETLTRRKPPEETGAALHRWLGLGATQTGPLARRTSGPRKKRPTRSGLSTEFFRPSGMSPDTSEVVHTPSAQRPFLWTSRSHYWRRNLPWVRTGAAA